MILSNAVYDILNYATKYVLPALAALYYAIASIWGLPYTEQVLGSIAAVEAFIAAIIGLSSANYEGDGTLKIDTSSPEKDTYRFELNIPVEDLANKSEVTFKVEKGVELPEGIDKEAFEE